MEPLKQLKSLGIFAGLILAAVGVLFLVFNKQVTELLGLFVGLGILAIGAIKLIVGLKKPADGQQGRKVGRIIISIIIICIGIFLIIDNKAATSLIGIVTGIFAFAAAFDRFMVAGLRRKMGLPIGYTIFFGVIHILFGILMIYASFQMISLMVILTGIYLLVAGVLIIISAGFLGDLQQPSNDTEDAGEQPAGEQYIEEPAAEEKNTGDDE